MKKAIYSINVPYMYDKAHKGAPYFIPALGKWCNLGEFSELQLAFALTGEVRGKGNTAYDVGSDIPEYGLSVKCGRASLANNLGDGSKEERLDAFFHNVASTSFAYCIMVNDEMVVYTMNKREFRGFCDIWAYATGKKLRLYKNAKMHVWCEERVDRG